MSRDVVRLQEASKISLDCVSAWLCLESTEVRSRHSHLLSHKHSQPTRAHGTGKSYGAIKALRLSHRD